jgi:glutathione S-transferase
MEAEGLTLIYWNVRGIAEPVKMMLEYLHLPYKEVKLELDEQMTTEAVLEQWTSLKDRLGVEFATLPCLHDGGSKITLSCSIAICRFLGQKYRPKMVGSAMNEFAEVDTLVSVMRDIRGYLDHSLSEPTAESRAATLKLVSEQLERINRYMRSKTWLSGKQASIADFFLCDLLDYIEYFDPAVIAPFPHLKKLQHKFNMIPEIAKYRETQMPFDPPKFLRIPPLTAR